MSQHGAKLEHVRALMATNPEQARVVCQRLAGSSPRDPWVASTMSAVLLNLGQTAQALHYAKRAAELLPGEPGLQVEFARLLVIENQHAKGVGVLRGVLGQHPGHAGALYQLAFTLEHMDLHGEAERVCREGLAHNPGDEGLASLLAGALLSLGRIEECVDLTRAAAERHPHNPVLASGLALMLNYLPGVTPSESLAAHRRYAALLDAADPAPTRVYANARDPGKRLRVGVLSPDLRQHSVAHFVEPWFEQVDASQLELVVYQTNRVADGVTARLRGLVEGRCKGRWRVMDNISDHGLAEEVHADRVDVLMELSGHTHAHSLPALHRRPAPVQVTYLGYPNTTGLDAVGYRLVDSHTDPAGAEAHATERLVRLDPCFLCYKPPAEVPERARGPGNGPPAHGVVFGSFNAVQKLNRGVIRVWAAILQRVPGARLLLKGGHEDDHALRAGVLARFQEAGVDAGRIEFLARTRSVREHLAVYNRVDIALDPFPYNGTTTTCEALLMGVPVVTLAGGMHAGRVGVSLLTNIGEPGLIAGSEQEYIARAVELAGDPGRRTQLRATIPGKLLASPLCDPAAFARRMEESLRACWSAWCAAG